MILDHYVEQRKTVNNEGYSDMFQNRLKPAAGSRRSGLLSSGVWLQRDNGRPHSASHTVKQIHNLKLEVLPQSPYLPDLATRDLHLFWPLKDALRGCHLRPDEEVKAAEHDWLAQQPEDFFCREMYALVERWKRCAERGGGDCIED